MHHVVFAITSKGYDIYSAMTRVAIASIRLTNPQFLITVACDNESNIALTKIGHPLLKMVDHWKVVETLQGEDSFRNRFVKTSLRSVISGPFLFLDSDILVRGDLSPIFQINADIAGARNHSRQTLIEQIWVKDQEILDAMNWQVSDKVYINGGVIFYNDNPKVYLFAETWHKKWLESYNIHKRHRDQPALNSSLFECQLKMNILEDKYNAQIKTSVKSAWDAKLWHYYFSVETSLLTQYEIELTQKEYQNYPNLMEIIQMIKRKHPWRRDNFFDDLVARKINKQDCMTKYDQTWFQGNRVDAIKMYLSEKYISVLKRLIRRVLSLINIFLYLLLCCPDY
ncbi:MAG: putative nucleotide-diphospho-sugar transferase [Mariniphaga sp.]